MKKNKVAIAEAEQVREVEVARFEALQANIIGEVNLANAQLAEIDQLHQQKTQQLASLMQTFSRTKAQFDAGEIDRLALTYAKLTLASSEKDIAQTQYKLEKAKIQLENTLQTPLYE